MAEVEMPQPVPGPVADENAAPASSGEIKTVFHDVNNFNVKHPLLNNWSLWVGTYYSLVQNKITKNASLPSHLHRKVTTGMIC